MSELLQQHAPTSTSTSPAAGSGTATSSSTSKRSGPPKPEVTAARITEARIPAFCTTPATASAWFRSDGRLTDSVTHSPPVSKRAPLKASPTAGLGTARLSVRYRARMALLGG
jgi:hypothetical protein